VKQRTDATLEQELRKIHRARATFDQYHRELVELRGTIATLPDEMTREIMVPFGKRAFFPGQLEHTNEIFVLLGANYYVGRSAKQACEIIDRRMAANAGEMRRIQEMAEKIEEKKGMATELIKSKKADAEKKMGVFDIGNGVMEIREPVDEGDEEIQAEMRRQAEPGEKKKQPAGTGDSLGGGGLQFDEFWEALGEADREAASSSSPPQSGASASRKKEVANVQSPSDLFNMMTTEEKSRQRVNVLFLDIDGVLVKFSPANLAAAKPSFDEKAKQLLARIIKASEPCEIVLSSNWKRTKNHRDEVLRQLRSVGIMKGFLDVTSDRSVYRQEQIYEWLIENKDRVRGYVVLDDTDVASHFRYRKFVKDHCVKTSPGIGLTAQDADRAVQILSKPAQIHIPKDYHQKKKKAHEQLGGLFGAFSGSGGIFGSTTKATKASTRSQRSPVLKKGMPTDTPESRAQFVRESEAIFSRVAAVTPSAQTDVRASISKTRPGAFTGEIVERNRGVVVEIEGKDARAVEKKQKTKKMSRFKAARAHAKRKAAQS